MTFDAEKIVVLDLAGDRCAVGCESDGPAAVLREIGFACYGGKYYCPLPDMRARLAVVKALVAAGALFSYGRHGSPAQLVKGFMLLGLITQPFLTVAWVGMDFALVRRCSLSESGAWIETAPG